MVIFIIIIPQQLKVEEVKNITFIGEVVVIVGNNLEVVIKIMPSFSTVVKLGIIVK